MTGLDISRVPTGEVSARQLVEAAVKLGDTAERHYLEFKSLVDLRSKVGQAKLAKFILGAANRLPVTSARAFEGHAIMVIGVGADGATGNLPIEMLELSRGLQPYLSVRGPAWDILRVPVTGGNEILLVIVAPPREGDPIFACYKNGEGIADGAIYFRGDGETRIATGQEFDLLVARASSGEPVVDIRVSPVGDATLIVDDHARTLEWRITDVTAHHWAAYDAAVAHGASILGAYLGQAVSMIGSKPEVRTREQYGRELDSWILKTRERWTDAVDAEAAGVLDPTVFQIINESDQFLQDVAVRIHLEGDVDALQWRDSATFGISDRLPDPPRRWGPVPLSTGIDIRSLRYATEETYFPSLPSSTTFRNSGSVTIDLDVGDLRPRRTWSSDGEHLVLALRRPGMTEVNGSWELTARGHHRVFSGELTVPVAKPLNITELIRAAFSD
ncbi:hypothetical protein [Cryobacterium sp. PH31-O1]|uniref:hypothetical protein n=1 Tax=Cryobacterium sp. PH31-O1 TaxID=3046306 RepID=UPI0024B8F6D7|nr:hypothetical protein [Cryobacterium sp. PH31-O1]MDJ0337928.1 hypothetical protein [Cryobacterium sp. PH31-O1]